MRLLADENIDGRLVAALRVAGHKVEWIAESAAGASDDQVLTRARALDAVLVTDDLDFGELVFRRRLVPCGVMLIRLHGLSCAEKAERVIAALRDHGSEAATRFMVIDARGVRIRSLP